MARRTRRKYYKRKSGRWAPNIVKISSVNQASVGEFFNYENLCVNPIQSNTGVSQTFTAKNFEITFTLETPEINTNLLESITAYIMFVPQGMNITSSYYAEHPEYIMAYKYLGSPMGRIPYQEAGLTMASEVQQYQPIRIRTRLSRKLQTGDKIILFIQGSNESSNVSHYNIDGIVRWWTKAN